ncbi:hypothetical protein B0617_004281 [Salmonella enterica subsp. enterica serovar Oslo]|nr:hypothetical protein [Salmonella enterica subsp. enterica serovar Oslo]EDQ0109551.1 hypothetical protein [Salmonella enterica subsp. enterica serovar Oslo]EDT5697371.1 hypothetical protein [Salmonella enterica subsp. enterica serovar Eastbourne]
MSQEKVEKLGDFSVKEFQIFLYNQTNKHEIDVVKNIKKRMLFGILVPYSPESGSLSRIRFIASSISDCASAEMRENS